jgi:prepilin-type N-terminal cleavage/methylation domain-containing protein
MMAGNRIYFKYKAGLMIRRDAKGFTLVELMIIVAIISIVAFVAVAKYIQLMEKSRESTTKANINAIKSACEIYYGGHAIWPTTLWSSPDFSFSVYLDAMPPVKVTGSFVTGSLDPSGTVVTYTMQNGAPTDQFSGWLYDSTGGFVYVNSTIKDSSFMSYSFYGFQ